MNKHLFELVLLVLLNVGLYSCIKPPCQCEPIQSDHVDIKIVDRQGQNLVYCPSKVFPVDSLRVLKNSYDFSVHNASVSRSFSDTTAIQFDFFVPEKKSYMYYNHLTKQDTLDIDWVAKKRKCCGEPYTFQAIEGVKLNGVPVKPQNGIYQVVK